MKIKSMTKYSFSGALKAYLIFAAIIFAIINTVVIITAATVPGRKLRGYGLFNSSFYVYIRNCKLPRGSFDVDTERDFQKNIFLLNCYSIRPYCSNWFLPEIRLLVCLAIFIRIMFLKK